MTEQTITIEQIEALAAQITADETTRRAKLMRLIRAEARIAFNRAPGSFERMPTERRDEAGHWDNSYPPDIELCAFDGPRLLVVRPSQIEDVPTSGGFYYDWKRVTTDQGLYISRDGTIYGCDETGDGRVGQFAAHPGDCGVACTLEWAPRDVEDITDLDLIESALRSLAFPASVETR